MDKKIIAVVNQKGGTGKTTTSINFGKGLSMLGKKVLLIDLDPQANLTYSLGINAKRNISEVFTGDLSLKDILVEKEGIAVAPGSTDLVDIDISLVNQPNREYFLSNSIKGIKGIDIIIIDAPPSLSLLALNALVAANEVIIPLQPEVLSLQGLSQVLKTIGNVKKKMNPALKVRGVVMVMYDNRRNLTREFAEHIQENIDETVFHSRIRLNVKIAEAPSFGKSVLEYSPNSSGARDYLNLANEYLKMIENE